MHGKVTRMGRWLDLRLVAIALLFNLSAVKGTEAAEVEIAIESRGYTSPPPIATLLVGNGEGGDTRLIEVDLTAGEGSISVELPADSKAVARIVSEESWSQSVPLTPKPDTRVSIVQWPAGAISGQVLAAHKGERPKGMTITMVASASGPLHPEQAIISCPLNQDGRIDCVAPAGEWTVRMRSAGHADLYKLDVPVAAGSETDLGDLQLEMPKAIHGSVVLERASLSPQHASISLRTIPAESGVEGTELDRVSPDSAGNFSLSRVPSGTYRLVADHELFSRKVVPRIVVDATDVTLSEPLLLRKPVSLYVEVFPTIDPHGASWTLEIADPTSRATLHRVDSLEGGVGRTPQLLAGSHVLRVFDSKGNQYTEDTVDVLEDGQVVSVNLSLVVVTGEVSLDGEGFLARLWFGGKTGSVRVSTDSDTDGHFTAILPRPGLWTVDVEASALGVYGHDLEVEIPEPDSSGRATVAIELPDTRLYGTVLDEEGNPQPEAIVRVTGSDFRLTTSAETGVDGHFDLYGIEPDEVQLQAEHDGRQSGPRTTTIVEGDSVGPIYLSLRQRETVSGRILGSSRVPVAQAFVIGYPITAAHRPASQSLPNTRSSFDGEFELKVPSDTRTLRIWFLAPGYSLENELVVLPLAEPLQVTLNTTGGTVSLAGPSNGGAPVVFVNGEPVDLFLLREWAKLLGVEQRAPTIVVPAMPPGTYSYCSLQPSEAIAVISGAAQPKAGSCSTATLNPGGQANLPLANLE